MAALRLDLIRRYDGRGPRYTSYPTAVQFSDDLTFHPCLAEDAIRFINHGLLIGISKPNDLDRFWVPILGPVLRPAPRKH